MRSSRLRPGPAQADAEARESGSSVIQTGRVDQGWATPPLRHIADVLVRNGWKPPRAAAQSPLVQVAMNARSAGPSRTPVAASQPTRPFTCSTRSSWSPSGPRSRARVARAASLVDRAGGELTWQSAPGQGTSFQLKLPMMTPPATPIPTDGESLPAQRNDRAKTA